MERGKSRWRFWMFETGGDRLTKFLWDFGSWSESFGESWIWSEFPFEICWISSNDWNQSLELSRIINIKLTLDNRFISFFPNNQTSSIKNSFHSDSIIHTNSPSTNSQFQIYPLIGVFSASLLTRIHFNLRLRTRAFSLLLPQSHIYSRHFI
jgi:hypothetical protein